VGVNYPDVVIGSVPACRLPRGGRGGLGRPTVSAAAADRQRLRARGGPGQWQPRGHSGVP
jgi:hypothetical protein